ncbi:MAG: ATP-binding protein [Planctomycetota bacterium]
MTSEASHDLSALRCAEDSQQLTRYTIDRASMMAFWIGRSGRILYANQTAARTLGYGSREILGLSIEEIDIDCPSGEWPERWLRLRKKGCETVESRYRSREGQVVAVEISASYVALEEGEYVLAFATDISERKGLEEALRAITVGTTVAPGGEIFGVLVEHLASALHLPTAFVAEHIDGKKPRARVLAVWRDGALQEAFEYDLDVAPCQRLTSGSQYICAEGVQELFPEAAWLEELGARGYLGMPLSIATGEIIGHIAVLSEEPLRFRSTGISALRIFAARAAAELVLRLQERETEQAHEQLLQSQKMEAIGQLAGGVAHDFNNLLTVIQGYAELTLKELPGDAPLCPNLLEIRRAAGRASSLTQQLLIFGRKKEMHFQRLHLNTTVDSLRGLLRRLIREDILIHTPLDPALPLVRGDEGSIEQVIINLAINARDAMPDGGMLTVSTHSVDIGEEECRLNRDARPGRHVCLTVSDTGSGIPPEVREHVFEPFFTTKESGEGTGLGLAVVFGVVKQHDGWITVSSEPGEGTTMQIFLPGITQGRELHPEAEGPAKLCQGSGERILLVEDDELIRGFSCRALRENGYEVFEAGGVTEALEIFEREEGEMHLLFSDLVLSDRSGLHLAEDLVGRRHDLKVLLSSGYSDERSRLMQAQDRGYRYLQKPYRLADLLREVREVLHTEEYN